MNRRHIILLISIIVAFVTTSCSPAYVTAVRNFNKTNKAVAVMILRPQNIYYSNYKNYDDIKGLDTMNVDKKDALLKNKSDFLSHLDNKVINSLFVNNLIAELCRSNLDVYTVEYQKDFDNINNKDKFVIDMRQLEFDEYYDVVHDKYADVTVNIDVNDNSKYVTDTILYNKDNYLNAFSANMWLYYYNPYADTSSFLFATNNVTDYHDGYYYKDYNGDVLYYEDNLDLTYENVEEFLQVVARRYAGYVYDYIINDYINKNYPESVTYPKNLTLHYNIHNGKISLVDKNQRLIEIAK